MEINISGSLRHGISEFIIQTFSLLFFPNDNTFGKNKSGNFINIFAEYIEHNVEIFVKICYNGSIAEKSSVVTRETDENKELLLSIGRVFYEVASEMSGVYPPWGIHTGIRPAKTAGDVFEASNFDETMAIDILTNRYLMNRNKAALALETYKNGRNVLEKHSISDASDFSLYISIPFCPTRCTYCSFVSYSTPKLLKLIPKYIEKLVCELEYVGAIARSLRLCLKSVYIGGGTPAILSPSELSSVLQAVCDNFDTSKILEYTVECGRADVITREKLEVLKNFGVDRISINPQSLNDEILSKNGRGHTVQDFFDAYNLARDVGIANINADCIVGLRGETAESMLNTIEQLAQLRPENITIHTLCVKKSAELKVKQKNENIYTPTSPELSRVLDEGYDILKSAEYTPYYMYRQKYAAGNLENTGFSLDECECLYNIYMMDEIQTIFGAGAGAMTKLVRNGRIERIANYKYPFEYIEHDFQIKRDNHRVKLDILKN